MYLFSSARACTYHAHACLRYNGNTGCAFVDFMHKFPVFNVQIGDSRLCITLFWG